LHEYDTYLKVNPPLRTVLDRKALIEAVINGCVDCIASHHLPEDNDHKIIEFEYARNGMTGLQTTFSTIRTALPQLSPDVLVTLFSANPRKIFGLPSQSIEVGADASLSLFNLNDSWTPDRSDNLSKSVNSPFFGKSLQGKALGIINKGSVFLNEK
jgi:dihydroorotase